MTWIIEVDHTTSQAERRATLFMHVDILFILGAGASAPGGCPCMADFFRRSEMLDAAGLLDGFRDDWNNVLSTKKYFLSNHKTVAAADNLEWFFSTLDMGELVQGLGRLTTADLADTRQSLIRLIAATLERTQRIDAAAVDGRLVRPSAPKGYRELASLIATLESARPQHRFGVITFNYDLGLELALCAQGKKWHYPLTQLEDGGGIPIAKLHGSLNWLRDTNAKVTSVDLRLQEFTQSVIEKPPEGAHVTFPSWDRMCDYAKRNSLDPLPVIVPPSENKAGSRAILKNLWQAAGKLLERANVIVFIGYSMPDTDQFFKHFWSLGGYSESEWKHVVVIDRSGESIMRIQALLAGYARDRFKPFHGDACFGLSQLRAWFESDLGKVF